MRDPALPSAEPKLPPAPAPVARDANPWRWPDAGSDRSRSRRTKTASPRLEQIQRVRRARDEVAAAGTARGPGVTTSPAPPATALPDAPVAASPRKRHGRGGLAAIVPFGMFLVAMGIVASGAIDALRGGAGLGAFIPLLVFALIFGLGALRRARRGDRD